MKSLEKKARSSGRPASDFIPVVAGGGGAVKGHGDGSDRVLEFLSILGCDVKETIMSDYVLTVPEEVYTRAREIANEIAQPVEQVMIDHLRTLSAPLPSLPLEEEAELAAMRNLSDDALWTIAREQMAKPLQKRMQQLMDNNSRGTLIPEDRSELASLVERGQRLMLRKSEAVALLTQRGHTVTSKELTSRG